MILFSLLMSWNIQIQFWSILTVKENFSLTTTVKHCLELRITTFHLNHIFINFLYPPFQVLLLKGYTRENLIKEFGEQRYREIYQSLNFDCKYTYINKNFSITIKNPLSEIFQRLNNDYLFSQRILKNNKIKSIYKLIEWLKLYNFLKILPKRFYPYLIFVINRDS